MYLKFKVNHRSESRFIANATIHPVLFYQISISTKQNWKIFIKIVHQATLCGSLFLFSPIKPSSRSRWNPSIVVCTFFYLCTRRSEIHTHPCSTTITRNIINYRRVFTAHTKIIRLLKRLWRVSVNNPNTTAAFVIVRILYFNRYIKH